MKKLIIGMLLFGSINSMASETYTCDQFDAQSGNQVLSEAVYLVNIANQNIAEVVFQTFAPHSGPGIVSVLKADKSRERFFQTKIDSIDQAQTGIWTFSITEDGKAGLLIGRNISFVCTK